MFDELLSKLYSLELYYKNSHWTSKNSIFYGDHQLFDRLSEDVGSKIDVVAEKSIGVTGNTSAINLSSLLKRVYTIVSKLSYDSPENSKAFEQGLQLEQDLLAFITQVEPTQTIGVKNMLGDIA